MMLVLSQLMDDAKIPTYPEQTVPYVANYSTNNLHRWLLLFQMVDLAIYSKLNFARTMHMSLGCTVWVGDRLDL